MKKEKKFNFIDFEKGDFELIDRQDISFKVKGNNDVVLFRKRATNDYFAFESSQIDSQIRNFLGFCTKNVHPAFYQFKYGDEFFKEAKEFHEDNEMMRIVNDEDSKSFDRDFEFFKDRREEEFQESLGENRLFPAIVIKKGSERWKQYCDFVDEKLSMREHNLLERLLKSQNTAIFCINDDNSISLDRHFTNDLNYNILHGGNLIKINYGSINLLIDCGTGVYDEKNLKEKEEEAKIDAVPFANRQALDLGVLHISFNTSFNDSETKKEGDILIDQSAYDNNMFLIRGGDKTLLYTGGFQINERKSFENILENLPDKVDYLICEATNMFSHIDDKELEKEINKIMGEYKHTFVLQVGTNIDRLVSFYKASRENKKVFLIDTYVAGITENLPNIPNTKNFKDVYCFCDFSKKLKSENFVKKYESDWRLFHKSRKGLGYCEIGSPKNGINVDLSNFTMLVRPSMLNYLKRIDEDKKLRFGTSIFENSVLIYSFGKEYKEKEDVKNFLNEMEKLGTKIVDLHTKGQADKETIDRLKEKVNPSIIEYVHYTLKNKLTNVF